MRRWVIIGAVTVAVFAIGGVSFYQLNRELKGEDFTAVMDVEESKDFSESETATNPRDEDPFSAVDVSVVTVAPKEKVEQTVTKEALSRLEKRAEEGDDLAYYQLGLLYEDGAKEFSSDLEKATQYYKILADKGYAKAQFRLGYLYAKEGKRRETFELYEKSAAHGYDIAQHNIAYFYENDSEFRDYRKAAHYYALAAEQGLNQSVNNLASLYLRDLGVKRNVNVALKLYLHSYNSAPNLTALNNIALIYDQAGLYDEAIKYHTLAAENGVLHSLNRLGILYIQGNPNVKRSKEALLADYTKAFHYFRSAAETGDAEAHFQLGNLYEKGMGVELDGQYALYHYRLAAENGDSSALVALAKLYEVGDFVSKDSKKAYEYLMEAHQVGNPEADYLLGVIYLQGDGEIEADLERAEYYLRRAAVQTTMPVIREQALHFFTISETEER